MEKKKQAKYSLLEAVGFMLRAAWASCRQVPFLELLLAVLITLRTTAEMLLAPKILQQVESGRSLGSLLLTIGIFTLLLVVCAALTGYVKNVVWVDKIEIRSFLLKRMGDKNACTSYPNLLNTKFLALQEKSYIAGGNPQAPLGNIWLTLRELIAALLGLIVYLFFMTKLSPVLLLVVVLTAALSYLASRRAANWEYAHREETHAYNFRGYTINKYLRERDYAKDVRIFGLRAWLEELFDKTIAAYRALLRRREREYLIATLLDLVLTLARNGIAYAYLIALTLREGLSVSEFLLYFGALTGFTAWVTSVLRQSETLRHETLDIACVMEYLNFPEPFTLSGGELPEVPVDGKIELRLENVSFRYPEAGHDTISHMELTVHPGEKLAIVGLNGAGKSTLIKLLCGLFDPTEGRVLYNGRDIRSFDRAAYYRLFSAVFQDYSVLECSAAINVAQSVEHIDRERVKVCLATAGMQEKIESLPQGYDTPIGRRVFDDGVELSGGETQRLMLARALYKDAPILLLDEPTAALDPIAESEIYQKYNEMSRGKSSIFISHRLASTRFCDRILFLKDGAIAEEGTHEQLLERNGGYAELFAVQAKYYQQKGGEEA